MESEDAAVPARDPTGASGDVSLEEKVAFLQRPDAYPEPTTAVESVETHMAWVFPTDARAYKLKKPVRYEFLDFSTLEARHEDCRAEVRLNRRLAPDVYLGVVPLRARGGGLSLGGSGRVVDWLVRMTRLPRDEMLDRALERGEVPPGRLREAAPTLARFYAGADPVSLDPGRYAERLRRYVEENRRELTRREFGLPVRKAREVGDRLLSFMEDRRAMVEARSRDGRIVGGHGDLRPEHVCLREDPVVIDCIEFEREFRLVDPADELAYLGMECELLGAPWVTDVFLEEYRSATGDRPPDELVDLYAGHRAYLRAKLAVWHLRDDEVGDRREWIGRGRDYLELAARRAPR